LGDSRGSGRRDFFVSYTGADLPWAQWIAWELEAAGYTTILQEWDFQAGANFILEMHRAARETDRTVAVLSSRHLEALYTQPEWAAALVTDPTGTKRQLVPVRIEECTPNGLLAALVYIDLVGLDEDSARIRLRERIAGTLRGRSKPSVAPPAPMEKGAAAADGRPRFATALPPVWNLPYRRNPNFTGREEQLAALASQLDQGAATVAVTQAQAVHGTGGIGKTSLAVEYAYRHRARFEVVWWVRAAEPASLVGDYAALAGVLGLAEADRADQQMAALAVRRWLEDHDRWLLVLDNAQAPETPTGLDPPLGRLVDLIPQVVHGQALITTRDARWKRAATLAELDLFTPEEAVRFLLARSGSEDEQAAAEVAELLGWLPLALEQAGAYVREAGISLASYLDRLRRFPEVALAKGEPRDHDPADTVAVTWQVSLEQVRAVAGALGLLEVCAFLSPDDIPRDLVAQPADPPPTDVELAALATDPFALDEAVTALRRYGLVKASEEALAIHRLLQRVVRAGLDPDVAADRAGLAVRLLEAAFPEEGHSDVTAWPVCERLLPHALAAAGHAEQHATEPAATVSLLDRAAGYLLAHARYQQARELRERALALAQVTFGPAHEETGKILNNLGYVCVRAGDFDVAKVLLERALTIAEATLHPNHSDTGTALFNLGNAHRHLGDLDDARRYLERALAIQETALGPDHAQVGLAVGGLGAVLRLQGDLDGAHRHLERALAIQETALGLGHPEVATTLYHLGVLLHAMGDLGGAYQHLERALTIDQAALGPDHPEVAVTLCSLAKVLRDQGDVDGARQHLERALTIQEAALGRDHPRTQDTRHYLADL
jgi:tetratricopeptide (TPR) repeat protein